MDGASQNPGIRGERTHSDALLLRGLLFNECEEVAVYRKAIFYSAGSPNEENFNKTAKENHRSE